MKIQTKKILSFFIILFSLAPIFSDGNEANEANVVNSSKYAKWYIYEKTGKKTKEVYKGPFGTVEDALIAWMDDGTLPSKNVFYIGKNKRLKTNNPAVYYHKKLKDMGLTDAQIEEEFPEVIEQEIEIEIIEAIPIETDDEEDYDDDEDENYGDEIFDSVEEEEFEEIIELEEITETINETEQENQADPGPQIDRYKKVYLSDFMDIPQYELPENTEYEIGTDITTGLSEVETSGCTPLMAAIKTGNDWKIRSLLSAGADINEKDNDGWTALMYAVRYQSNLSILEMLLEKEPDIRAVNKYGHSALIIASCYNDNPDIIKRMLSYYHPSEKEVQKAFVLLLSSQSVSEYTLIAKMKEFLDMGLPINSYYNGKTPLMYACKYCSSTKVIELLLDNNATVNVRSSDGKTAFQYASENKNLKHDDIYWSLNTR